MSVPKHILAGSYFALAVVFVAGGWELGRHPDAMPQTADAPAEADFNATPSGKDSADAAENTPASSDQPADHVNRREPPGATRPSDTGRGKMDEQPAHLPLTSPAGLTPAWAVPFGEAISAIAHSAGTAKKIIRTGSVERHLTWTQIDRLNEIAVTLPENTPGWLTVECAIDRESSQFAQEIYSTFSASGRVKALTYRVADTDPNRVGVFVTVSGRTDEHFHYAQLFAAALNAPDVPVHFGPSKDGKAGVVRIIILRAEPVEQTEEARR